MSRNRVVTISREFGSGGRTIGRELAATLGIECYDREILTEIASRSGFSEDYISREGEYAQGFISAALHTREGGLSNQDQIWLEQNELILELAEKSSCVIVGRCADYILKDTADCLNVFIHSSMEKRSQRIVNEYGERDIPPLQRLKEKDKQRSAYYRFYTGLKWGEARNYHICLDSGALGLDCCVKLLAQLY